MNTYHIAYPPATKIFSLSFWCCNFIGRGCIKRKELQDVHLNHNCYIPTVKSRIIDLWMTSDILSALEIEKVAFMGGYPTIDPMLPDLAKPLHDELSTYNILLTNGFFSPSVENTNEIYLSMK